MNLLHWLFVLIHIGSCSSKDDKNRSLLSHSSKSERQALLSSKTIIRTKNFGESKAFYSQLLDLTIVEEWKEEHMSGCILQIGKDSSNAFIEIQAIYQSNSKYDPSFDKDFVNDKSDIQIETRDINYWVDKLQGKCPLRGPIDRPWGAKYLYLRDPDNLQVIIYQSN